MLQQIFRVRLLIESPLKQMGSNLSDLGTKIAHLFSSTPQKTAIMFGLQGAGKTTILYQMKRDRPAPPPPTIGFNIEQFKVGKLSITAWDLGGAYRIRLLWTFLIDEADCIIVVVDASDPSGIVDLKQDLHRIVNHVKEKKMPILIFLNKCDLSHIVGEAQLAESLELSEISKNKSIRMQPCSALKLEGLIEGFQWISGEFQSKK